MTSSQNISSDFNIITELEALKEKYTLLETSYYRKIEEYEDILQVCDIKIEKKQQEIERLKGHIEFLKEKTSQLEEKLNKNSDSRIKEIEESCEQEKQGLTDVINLMRERLFKKGNVIDKRALTVLNELIVISKGKKTVKLDSAKCLELIRNNVPELYARLSKEVNNPYKAVKDVFEKVKDIGKEKGLAISIENQRKSETGRHRTGCKKLLALKYEPAKDLHSAINVLNQLKDKLKVKFKLKIPTARKIHPDFKHHFENLSHAETMPLTEFWKKYYSG